MQMIFIPNQSVGQISFGLERNKVKDILPGFKGEFKKNKYSMNTTDDFGYCHVFYDKNDQCIAIEFFESIDLLYNNHNLFELNVNEIKRLFNDVYEEYGSYISVNSSIGFFVEGGKIESILLGCKDYYK